MGYVALEGHEQALQPRIGRELDDHPPVQLPHAVDQNRGVGFIGQLAAGGPTRVHFVVQAVGQQVGADRLGQAACRRDVIRAAGVLVPGRPDAHRPWPPFERGVEVQIERRVALQAAVGRGDRLVDKAAAVFGVAEYGRDPERTARHPDHGGPAAPAVGRTHHLPGQTHRRGRQAKGGHVARGGRIGGVAGEVRLERGLGGQAVGRRADDPRIIVAWRAPGRRRSARVEEGRVLLHGAEAVDELALRQRARTYVDPLHLFATLAAGAVKHQTDGVETEAERHVLEIVASVRGLRDGRAEHFVDVELDLVAGRQVAAQVDLLEYARPFERLRGESHPPAAHAAGAELEERRVGVSC